MAGLCFTPPLTGTTAEKPYFVVDVIEADGMKLPLEGASAGPVRLPSNTRSVDIGFAPVSVAGSVPLRFRYQLEGYDRGWRDPIGVMRFAVRFNDAADNTISGEEFDAFGESPGWTGTPETALFKERLETLDVPPGAARLQVWLSSAGPHQTMGIYALDALVVTFVSADPSVGERSVEMISRAGSLMETGTGTPAGWARHGTSLGIAQIGTRDGKPPLIVMRDDRSDAFGGWLTRGSRVLPLAGVSKIHLKWREAYSIGWGGSARVSYPYLPAGVYRLRLQALNVEGGPQGAESVLQLSVVPPFYQTRRFWIGSAALAATALGLLVRQATRRRMQRRLDVLVGERAVERERSRIARDLHDNLGADLTHLALLSDLAQADAGDAVKAKLHFDQIFDLARSLTRQVDEMVWAVNPANDSLKGFVPFLSNYAQNYLLAAGIPCRLDLPAVLEDAPLSSAQRHHLFLTVKEALHNILKHARATEARLLVRTQGSLLAIRIEDNGRGISGPHSAGDGTGNMQQRLAGIGGTFERTSALGKGTAVCLTLPLVRSI
jgi:signal transduction histidine kinase